MEEAGFSWQAQSFFVGGWDSGVLMAVSGCGVGEAVVLMAVSHADCGGEAGVLMALSHAGCVGERACFRAGSYAGCGGG